jgi:tRNA A-37 threonylcarbamoyl transferase component Bud32
LENYGVRHGDPFVRNVTYNTQLGRFCIIDFEFATILETGEGLTIEDLEKLERPA